MSVGLFGKDFISCVRRGDLEGVKKQVYGGVDISSSDYGCLRWAAFEGHLEIVKYLVEQGADIHTREDLAVSWAIERGKLNVVKFLCEKGANIHAENNKGFLKAHIKGHEEVVDFIMEKGDWRTKDISGVTQLDKLGVLKGATPLVAKLKDFLEKRDEAERLQAIADEEEKMAQMRRDQAMVILQATPRFKIGKMVR
jgi:ankyrin repeat protein